MYKMYRASFIADQDGHLLDARLQGIAPGLVAWIDLRKLEVSGETNLLECQPTQEDKEKLDLASNNAQLEILVKDLEIAKNDAYRERNLCVAGLAAMARLLGYRVGIADHQPQEGEDWDMEWGKVLFIDLPTGQVSWHLHISEWDNFAHLPAYPDAWDGHDTPEKYRRLQAFTNRTQPW